MDFDITSERLGQQVRLVAAREHPSAGTTPVAAGWVWLLHGRGSSLEEVSRVVDGLADAMVAGDLAPRNVVAPHGPWLDGAAWWVDSDHRDGLPVETALVREVLPMVEAGWGPPRGPEQRIVAGYSMGGRAALRWLLACPDLFGAAALVAPAAYVTAPPIGSSARSSGAFGVGDRRFDQRRWEERMSYQQLLSGRRTDGHAVAVAIVVGDAETVETYPTGRSSLLLEAARLHTALTDDGGISSNLRVVGGTHSDDFWVPALTAALRLVER